MENDVRELLIQELTNQITNNYKDNKPIRGHIRNYNFTLNNQYSFVAEFISNSDMELVAMNNETFNSEVYPLNEKYHLTYHFSPDINIPDKSVVLERRICVINNDEIEEFYNIGDINMYNEKIKPYKNIIVKDFASTHPDYKYSSLDEDKFYRYIEVPEGKITIPFKFYLEDGKIPKEKEAGFYLTRLDEQYMANHPLEYRQYSIDDPNEKIINYEDCVEYSKKCITECKYYYSALKEAYERAKKIKTIL